MSHFTVTVKVTKKRLDSHDGDVEEAVAEMLAPYNENAEDDRYREFDDTEDEQRKKCETEGTERVRTPDGKLLLPWDERFRVTGTFGTGSNTHSVPSDCEEIEVPFRDTYKTFEEYMRDWCGHDRRDSKTGRYGHWHNPNGYWDWYQIGGRWTGFYPVKAGAESRMGEPGLFTRSPKGARSDIVRIDEIDMVAVEREMREKAEEFFGEYKRSLTDRALFSNYDGPRSRAMSIGLVEVVREPILTPPDGCMLKPWSDMVSDPNDTRREWTDVCRIVERDAFMSDYIDCFNPIATYAAVDNDGWHAPGKMGWWACSSETSEQRREFCREFMARFVRNSAPDDLLVCVDCHV